MLQHLKNVLSAEEVAEVRDLAAKGKFVEGKVTNPNSRIKNNLQMPYGDPHGEQAADLVIAALTRNQAVKDLVYPKQISRPTVCRYIPGMTYGFHVDAAIFRSDPPMRSDVSCTVFISGPDEYEGGELEIQSGSGMLRFKGNAGDAVIYPSTTVHRVAPIEVGERLVAINWFQSMVRDQRHRDVLAQLQQIDNVLYAAGDPQGSRILVDAIRTNLLRMWAEL
jgi:PKHD-type hydroxylase